MDATLDDLRTPVVLRAARLEAGLAQAALAARLGVDQSTISRWESGRDEPSLRMLARALRACGRRARLVVEPDDGVDRAQLRQHLAMSPDERLQAAVNLSRLVASARRA